jgi:hypothetical protein
MTETFKASDIVAGLKALLKIFGLQLQVVAYTLSVYFEAE